MARTSTYLNFPRQTEAAFHFYKGVFGGEFGGQGIVRFSDIPAQDDAPQIAEADLNLSCTSNFLSSAGTC